MATNFQPYEKTDWYAGKPITEYAMDKLELGVEENRDDVISLQGNLNTVNTLVQAKANIDYVDEKVLLLNNAINNSPSSKAWTALTDAGVRYNNSTSSFDVSLKSILDEISASVADVNTDLSSSVAGIKAIFGTKIVNELPVTAYSSDNTVYSNIEAIKNAIGRDANGDLLFYYNADNALNNTIFKNINAMSTDLSRVITQLNNAAPEALYSSLADRLARIDNSIASVATDTDVAHVSSVYLTNSQPTDYGTLDARFEHLEGEVQANTQSITTLDQNKLNANSTDIIDGFTSNATLKALSANSGRILRNIIGGSFDGVDNNTVANAINTAQADAQSYSDANKIDKTQIYNDLDYEPESNSAVTTHKVLDAAQGKALNDRLIDTEAELSTAHVSSVIKDTVEDPDTHELTEVNKEYDSIDSRFEAIETHKKAIADEIEAARTSSIVRTEIPAEEEGEPSTFTDTTYGSLDARLEAIETHAAAARTDVNTIAEELGMMTQAGAIEDTNTKVDRLNDNVLALGKEIGMLSEGTDLLPLADAINRDGTRIDTIDADLNTVTTGIKARLDTAETNINNLQGDLNTATTGVKARITALETNVNDATSGLAATKAIADANASAISHAASGNDPGGLTERIIALETEPRSATEVITQDYIEYDNEGNPTIYSTNAENSHIAANVIVPSPDKDYLLQKDNKYYYWKYIQTGENTFAWVKISGEGSGGGGTSSASFAETLAAITNPNVNTDYFVGNDNDGYVHYRFISTVVNEQTVLSPVAIANYIDKNQINQYRMVIRDIPVSQGSEETNKWLYLYKFNYGESPYIDTDEEFTDPIWATRQVDAIQLPEGGGGGTYTTLKVTRITPRAITAAKDSTDKRTYIKFFFTDGEAGETYRYSLTLNGKTIIPSSQDTQITSGDPEDKSSSWPESTVPLGFYSIDITPYCTTLGLDQQLVLTIAHADNENLSARTIWDLSVVQFNLTSSSPDGLIVNRENEVILNYTPAGAIEKTLYIVVGETTYTRNLSSSVFGREYEFAIPANSQSHGAHTIEMYMKASINNGQDTLETDHILKEYIWYDPSLTEDSIIIACPSAAKIMQVQSYTDIQIPYSVYHKEEGTYNIEYYLNYGAASQKLIGSVSAEGNYIGRIDYTPYTITDEQVETQTITIKIGSTMVVVSLQVSAIDADVAPIKGEVIDFDPSGLTNNSVNRLPSWTVGNNTYRLTASPNFNWSDDVSGGGYKEDEDGKCFVIKAGSYVDLDYPFFKLGLNDSENNSSTVFDRGSEIKIIFKTSAVRNIKAVWFSNTGTITGKTVGLQLGVHSGELRTDKAADQTVDVTPDEEGKITINDAIYYIWQPNTDYYIDDIVVLYDESDEDNHLVLFKCISDHNSGDSFLNSKGKVDDKKWLAGGKIDTEILATNSYLYMPYSEEDKIELDININKYAAAAKNNFIMSYEDGVPSKVYSYTYGNGGDALSHSNTIHIGSPDCDVYIYRLRIYNRSLSTSDILQNFIADGRDIKEKLARYNRNCIYWNRDNGKYYPSPSESAVLDPVRLARQIPNVKVLMLDTPTFTTGKKNFVMNSTLRCIHAVAPDDYDGNIYYASRGDADNWFFYNGFHSGQGTTSDNYGQSGRNVDFLFESDGEHWPAVKKDIEKTYSIDPEYKSTVLIGENASTWEETEPNSGIYHWVPARSPETNEVCDDWIGDKCKVSLTETSVPNNYFNLKVNIASSENVNNALFQARYNQFIKKHYPSPATARQKAVHGNNYENIDTIDVKNSMEFVPAVLFIRESAADAQGNPLNHNEFNDCDWHFYALGNIGDSKKTDYTRAYDPEDMNEFTCENSDNNTNNGQFQSGVFMYRNNRAIETPYKNFSADTAYKTGDKVIVDGKIYIRTGGNQAQGAAWDETEWQEATLTNWYDENTPYFAPFTAPNTMEYMYPISPSEWNVKIGDDYVNYKHNTLVTEKFDGDHSFEFRYACQGDFRDGKLINPPDEEAYQNDPRYQADKAQEKLNHDTMLALYEWLLTSTQEQYIAEADQWFVKPAMEFFYAFTHYYTMMDNRAKNTFWHFAKTGTHRRVSRPVPEMLHVYDELVNGSYEPTQDTAILAPTYYVKNYVLTTDQHFENGVTYYTKDQNYTQYDVYTPATVTVGQAIPSNTYYVFSNYKLTTDDTVKAGIEYYTYLNNSYTLANTNVNDTIKYYYTEYAFDLWAYDMDTALGIDNNGALAFPYGVEDTDYRTENDSLSGYAFNGAGSIFWRRLSSTFANEIRDIMNGADENCFNTTNLIDQFDHFQECFPEEIWRLDIERKYIRTFTGLTKDNSITVGKQNPRFLTSMMQGRKKYQRRQWMRDQGVYFNSKYRLTDIIKNENTVEFNCTTPAIPEWASGTYYPVNQKVFYAPEVEGEDINRRVYRCIVANSDAVFNSSKWVEDVTPTYHLSLKPYQDMYLNVQVGNGNYQESYVTAGEPTLRAKAGQEYIFDITGNYQETRIYINGANHLSGIGNLAPMYPYSFDLRALAHIKTLDIGTEDTGYVNTKFTELKLPNHIPLLETLNIKNCHSLAGTIQLDEANNIREVEAAGTAITGISLPDYTNIEVLHIPSTMTDLNLYGARFLSDFKVINSAGNVDYGALYKLHVYDSDYQSTVNWMSIASDMLVKQSPETKIQLLKLNLASIPNISILEQFDSFKPSLEPGVGIIDFSGLITIEGDWSVIEAKTYASNIGHYIVDENENTVWQPLYSSSNAAWPELTLAVDTAKVQTKHQVWYVKENAVRNQENEFEDDDVYAVRYVTNGDPAPDIYYDESMPNYLSPLSPTKPKDKRKKYTFGLRDARTAKYVEYSGWSYEGSNRPITTTPIVEGETVLKPYFNETDRLYTINWYLDENKEQLVKSSESPVGYGEGYEEIAPTPDEIHKAGHETCSITINNGQITECKIFDGWQTLPANIDPSGDDDNFDIFAKWNSYPTSIVNMFKNTDNLTPQQLLTLSSLTEEQKETYGLIDPNNEQNNLIKINTTLKYQLGHDSIKPGTTIYSDKTNPIYFDGVNGATTNIQPLLENNDAFTLVIDYCLESLTYNKKFAIIASCYHSADGVRSGLGVFYDREEDQVCVGFGSMYNKAAQRVAISGKQVSNKRNILVIRHPKNSSTIFIYSSGGDGKSIPEEIFETYITRDSDLNYNSNAYLNFCQLIDTNRESIQSNDANTSNITSAKCNIYWAKYWNEDLGYGECLQLASWPHEWMTFGIPYCYKDNNSGKTVKRASGTSIPTPTLYLTTLNTPMHGQFYSDRKQQGVFVNNLYGWGTEDNALHDAFNKRVYRSLPTELQSILCKPSVIYQEALFVPAEDQYGTPTYTVNGENVSAVRDYAFACSVANLKANADVYENEDEVMNPFDWLISQNVQVYTRATNQSWTASQVDGINYLNLRFPGKAIHFGTGNSIMRVYQESISSPINTIVQSIGNTNIRSGDIYIDTNGAYIYVSNEEINTYGLIIMSSTDDNSKFAGVADNIPGLSNSEGLGGWVKANSYWTRSIYCGSSTAANFTYVQGNDSNAGQVVLATQAETANINYLLAL